MAGKKNPEVTPDATPEVIPAEAVVERTALVTAKKLNLRQGPGYEHAVKAVLDEGSTVILLELPQGTEVPGWAAVRAGDELAGWVDEKFIQEEKAEE